MFLEMGLMEISIMHHVGLVLVLLWGLSHLNLCHPVAYFVSLIYLYLVHERYVMRLRKKLEYEEKRQSFRRRVLSDSESVRWLNHAVQKIWPICMEQIASQKILLPIIPWFLEKYKPWTAKKAVVQHLYLGRNPPLFTEMRVLRQCSDDDHLVLELGMNFLTADDMSAILAVKLRKRLGFGMWAKLHITGMHVEGKVLIGVKFLRQWPFLGRMRVCFAEPPYFQMTVKPIFTHGLDVTDVPGIAGWLDKLLSVAFEQTLVEPNMLVVDVEKFASPQPENWFSVDEKQPLAHAKVEVIEASDMKPSDLNGLADPYVKGQLGPYRFRSKTHKKTLSPKWHEEFMIPICSWETPNVLIIEVRDKDHFVDDTLGKCTVNIGDFRGGRRHDMWLSLQNIKMGRLHLAITVLEEDNTEGSNDAVDAEALNKEDIQNAFADKASDNGLFSPISSKKSPNLPDHFEPINVDGQQETGIWVHQPGSEVSQTWEPRKGKARSIETQIHRVSNDSFGSNRSAASGSPKSDCSYAEDNHDAKNRANRVMRGLRKISSVFQMIPKSKGHSGSLGEVVQSPYVNLRAVNDKEVLVKFVADDNLSGPSSDKLLNEGSLSPTGSSPESPSRMKGMAKSILKHAEKSARGIKHVLSSKGSKKSRDLSAVVEQDFSIESDSSDDESLSSPGTKRIPAVSNSISSGNDDTRDTREHVVLTDSSNQVNPAINVEGQIEEMSVEGPNEIDDDEVSSPIKRGNGLIESPKPKPPEGNSECEKKVEDTPETDTKV